MIWSAKQEQCLCAPYDHCLEVYEGTPRSAKTTTATFRFARHLIETTDQNHLVVAYSQEQAYRLVIEGDGMGLSHIFEGYCLPRHDDNGDHLEVYTPSGTKHVYYKGGGKVDSQKSLRGMSLGSVYFCEIDLLHPEMIQECFRRTFAARDRWHIADLNPPAPFHPVIRDVFDVQDTVWTHWTLDDNPIITPQRKKELYKTLSKNPYLLARDWYGKRAIPQGVIYSMFDTDKHVLDRLPRDQKTGETVPVIEMYITGDGGLVDATSIGCHCICRVDGEYRRYRVANWYYSGADSGRVKAMSVQAREIVQAFLPYCRELTGKHESFVAIDPACKALRAELELLGVPTERADNNAKDIKGSSKGIEVGIEYLQSAITDGRFYLVDNSRFGHENYLREIGMYCVDDKGKPIDAYNHAMDEDRYANNYFYKQYVL